MIPLRNICKEERIAKGASQEDFAKLLGVTRQTIIRWERDPEKIPVKKMVSILTLSTKEVV
jgi:DNA-binding XRE family transcriptional regulator